MDEQEKNLKKYLECLTKHLRQKEITKLKCGRIICSLVRLPKSQLTPNGLPAQVQLDDEYTDVFTGEQAQTVQLEKFEARVLKRRNQ